MSNADIVRRRLEEFIAGIKPREEEFSEDFVWDMSTFGGWPEQQEYPGLEGTNQFLREWIAAWDDWRIELEDVYEVASGEVIAIQIQHGIHKTSGLDVEMRFAQVWNLDDEGRYLRMRMYSDVDRALADAGV